VFLLAPTVHVVSYAGEIEFYKEEVRKNPDDAVALLISAFSTSFRGQKFHPACKLLVS
jgi:hypothetical protein